MSTPIDPTLQAFLSPLARLVVSNAHIRTVEAGGTRTFEWTITLDGITYSGRALSFGGAFDEQLSFLRQAARDHGEAVYQEYVNSRADSALALPELRKARAICGLLPAHGWGMDLFIEKKCERCVARVKLQGGSDD